MESISNVVRVSLPNYLRDLPIPTSVFGWFQLGLGDWARLLPFGTVAAGVTYLAVSGLSNTPVLGPVIKVIFKKRVLVTVMKYNIMRLSARIFKFLEILS